MVAILTATKSRRTIAESLHPANANRAERSVYDELTFFLARASGFSPQEFGSRSRHELAMAA